MPQTCRGTWTLAEKHPFAVLVSLDDIHIFPAASGSSVLSHSYHSMLLKKTQLSELLVSDQQSQGWI